MTSPQAPYAPTFIWLLSIIFLVPVIFLDTSKSMINVWIANETFTHGFLIFPISIWLIWKKRVVLNKLSICSEPKVLVLMLPTLVIWLLGNSVDILIIQQFAMISLIPIIIWISLGRVILYAALFPLLFLFFSVPFGQELIPPMMNFTANFTVKLIQLSGIPIYQDGLYFSLPSGSWSVVEECSGVRYLIASVALGTLYAQLSYISLQKRMIFIFVSGIFPIFANVLRAYFIVMIGHLSNMQLATGADHLLYGWVFFGIMMFLMFYIGSRWWDPMDEILTVTDKTVSNNRNIPSYRTLIVAILLVTLTQVLASIVTSRSSNNIKPVNLSMPDKFGNWQYNTSGQIDWDPEIHNPDALIAKEYVFENDYIQLNIALYLAQRNGAEAITTLNRLVNPYNDTWKIISFSDLQQQDLHINESILQRGQDKILVWHWYRIGNYQTSNKYIGKIIEVYNLFFTGRTDASMITLVTPLNEENLINKRETLIGYWTYSGGSISRQLDTAALN